MRTHAIFDGRDHDTLGHIDDDVIRMIEDAGLVPILGLKPNYIGFETKDEKRRAAYACSRDLPREAFIEAIGAALAKF